LFTTVAEAYDAARPGYPPGVRELLVDRAGLAQGSRVVEIGLGTGQATAMLLDAGASVTAIELGAEMAAVLVGKFVGADLDVIVRPFESATLPASSFDLVVAATSFHWLSPEVALARCADLLAPGGWIALWWNHYGDPDRPDDVYRAIDTVLERLAPVLVGNPPTASNGLDVAARMADFERVARFDEVHHEVIRWTIRQSGAQVRALFETFSPFLALPAEQRVAVLDEIERVIDGDFGGVVERIYLTPIYLAQLLR
jgi:SAM-dependent methyltransferase